MVEKIKVAIKNVKLGKNVKIIEPVNLYDCEIGDNCFIGPFVEIQKNVTIKENSRIQSHSFICENVSIGKNCFIGHGVNFINDKFQNNNLIMDPKKFLKTIVMDNVKIGSNSTILPVKIENNVIIGAGSVVTKNCKKDSTYIGNPAKNKKWLR